MSQGQEMAGGTFEEQMAAEVRRLTGGDEWDEPHAFCSYRWLDGRLEPGTYVVLGPSIDPDDYREICAMIAVEERLEHPEDAEAPMAYLIAFEAHGVLEPADDASEEEKAQFERDRLSRSYHKRPDAREIKMAIAADATGRVWVAQRYRDDDTVKEVMIEPGTADAAQYGGRFPEMISSLAVKMAAGVPDYVADAAKRVIAERDRRQRAEAN